MTNQILQTCDGYLFGSSPPLTDLASRRQLLSSSWSVFFISSDKWPNHTWADHQWHIQYNLHLLVLLKHNRSWNMKKGGHHQNCLFQHLSSVLCTTDQQVTSAPISMFSNFWCRSRSYKWLFSKEDWEQTCLTTVIFPATVLWLISVPWNCWLNLACKSPVSMNPKKSFLADPDYLK